MNLTEIEKKMLRLGLDAAAKSGEIDASAIKFFRQLRKRKMSFEEFTNDNASDLFSGLADLFKHMEPAGKREPEQEDQDWKKIAIKQQTTIKIQERRIKLLEKELIRK